jgi:hypothetical protein
MTGGAVGLGSPSCPVDNLPNSSIEGAGSANRVVCQKSRVPKDQRVGAVPNPKVKLHAPTFRHRE